MRTSITVLVLVLTARSAAADTWVNPYTGGVFNNPMSSLADTFIRQSMERKMLQNMLAQKQGEPAQAEPATAHEPYAKTDFKPARKRLVVDQIIAGLAQNDDQRAGLATGVDQVFLAFEKAARKNNVSYALAFLIAASASVYSGNQVSDEQSEQLALAINDALARSPQFAKASASDRQKIYETCVTLGGLVMLFAEVGKHDEASAKAAKLLAKQSLAMLGIS